MSIKLKGSSDGSVSFDAPADTSPSGSDITLVLPTTVGSAEQFLKNSGTAGTLEFSSMVETSTGVGIGTSSPSRKLHIVPSGSNAYDAVQVGDGLYIGNTSNNNNAAVFHQGGGADLEIGSQQHITFTTGDIAGSATERMRIDSSGNVGIGTTNIQNTITVFRGSTQTCFLGLSGNGNNPSSACLRIGQDGSGIAYLENRANTALVLSTNATERMRIDSSGQVGISNTIPGSFQAGGRNLVVGDNSAEHGITIYSTTSGNLYFGDGTSGSAKAEGYIQYLHSLDRFDFGTSNSTRMVIDSSGRLLIGTTTEGQANADNFTIADSGNCGITIRSGANNAGSIYFSDATSGGGEYDGWIAYNQPSRFMQFGTGQAERMRLDISGRLLVGLSTSPSAGSGQYAKLVSTGNISTSTGDGRLMLGRGLPATSMSSGQDIGSVLFTDNTGATFAAISSNVDTTPGSGDYPGRLSFATTNDGGATPTEAMRIDNNGRVGIGTASAAQVLQVHKATSSPSYVHITNNVSGSASSDGMLVGLSSSAEAIVWNQENTVMRFATNNAERARITDGGYFKAANNASYINSTAGSHEFNQSGNAETLTIRATNSSFSSTVNSLFAVRSATSAYWFIRGVSSSGGAGADNEFYIRGDGRAFADESWNGGGADYAEYFEWSDGNTEAEDRRGISVVLDGDKIREAVTGEEPVGVVSGHPSVVGDADMDRWKGKYLRDDYGSYVLDEDGYRQLNPDFDSSVEYVQREDRPEWDTVGLMGKLRIRKGQVTGTRWIKMRDVSDTVEEWLVR